MEQVVTWLVEGQSDGDIVETIGRLWPTEDAATLLLLGVKELEAAGKVNGALIRGWCLKARLELYRRMLEIGDFSGALAATVQIEKLADKMK